jgi:hypothetical protein
MPPESSYQPHVRQQCELQAALSAKKKTSADEAEVEVIQAIQKTTSAVTSGAGEPERSDVN